MDEPSHFLQELPVKSPKGTVFISGNLFSTSWEIEAAQTFMRKHLLITGFALVIYFILINHRLSTLLLEYLEWFLFIQL